MAQQAHSTGSRTPGGSGNYHHLQIHDPDKPLVIKRGEPKYAIGPVLEQEGKPIAFRSRKTGERERLLSACGNAVAQAPPKWRQFVGSKTVTVKTDNAT